MKTQRERLLKHLRQFGTITPIEAWRDLGIYRLGARIHDLRRSGYLIEMRRKEVLNQFGEPCLVGEYTLVLRKKLYYASTNTFTLGEAESMGIPIIKLRPRFAYYAVRTTPDGAKVYIDQKLAGTSPLQRAQLESGSYVIKIEKELYHPVQRDIELKDADDETLSFDLKPAFGELAVRSVPEEGATVLIDGSEVGRTPYTNRTYPSGTYSVRV